MSSDLELTASWRADADKSQPFDEDLQVIQPKATKKKLAPSAEDLRPTGRPALLEGLSKPLVYHRSGNLSTALQTLVHLLEESRTIASASRPGKDADDLDFAVQQVASAWKDFNHCLPASVIFEERGHPKRLAIQAVNMRFDKSLAELTEFATLATAVDDSLKKCIEPVVRRMIEEFGSGKQSVQKGVE
ncbi:hypothetical protein QFC20_006609 [Naganishia adeliensis]|uniref:Uncharacterized protein n=1 Tax=Naganishia adeliensis TaxID=92952 RepID=A0ACC2V9B1_9TREE|nr:hypothetical protein QFC20_006609 [Naganishia adeliensis]